MVRVAQEGRLSDDQDQTPFKFWVSDNGIGIDPDMANCVYSINFIPDTKDF